MTVNQILDSSMGQIWPQSLMTMRRLNQFDDTTRRRQSLHAKGHSHGYSRATGQCR